MRRKIKAALWNDLHPDGPPRHGLIILDTPAKTGGGNQYISCACGGGGAEELDETARHIVTLWNSWDRECYNSGLCRSFSEATAKYIERIQSLKAINADMLAVLEELRESASYWSEYDVPLGIVERLDETIMKARGEE